RLIALALLRPGWEGQSPCRPPIAPVVCVGKVISHSQTDEGNHNILLVGVKRARVTREVETDRSYREAEVEVLEDHYPVEAGEDRSLDARRLQELFLHFVPDGLAAQESFKQLVGKQLPLGILTDTIT